MYLSLEIQALKRFDRCTVHSFSIQILKDVSRAVWYNEFYKLKQKKTRNPESDSGKLFVKKSRPTQRGDENAGKRE